MKLSHFTGFAALALVALNAGAQAQTSVIGSFGFTQSNIIYTPDTTSLTTSTDHVTTTGKVGKPASVVTTGYVNTTNGDFDDSQTSPSAPLSSDPRTGTTLTLVNQTPGGVATNIEFGDHQYIGFTITDENNVTWTFTATSNTIDASMNSFHVEEFGTFTNTSGFSQNAELSTSYTSVGSSGINASYTFYTPPATPEPGVVAMLAGMGLSGAGFLVRRRK